MRIMVEHVGVDNAGEFHGDNLIFE